MRTLRKLLPGQPGTRKILAEYGERLVCVRYRYDRASKRRLKTVELVIAQAPWEPPPAKIASDRIVQLRVKYGEVALGRQVRAAGGKWNREKQFWELPYDKALQLGLSNRIVESSQK
ncbi:MAG: hypothetical protein DKINENOH_01008 [bacterium]|nr:hypothetical protein [bacterium]